MKLKIRNTSLHIILSLLTNFCFYHNRVYFSVHFIDRLNPFLYISKIIDPLMESNVFVEICGKENLVHFLCQTIVICYNFLKSRDGYVLNEKGTLFICALSALVHSYYSKV